MPTDEIQAFARLDSPMFGALWHAAAVVGPVAAADVVAARVFDAVPRALGHVVDARRLKLGAPDDAALQAWALADDSVFGYARDRKLTSGQVRLGRSAGENGTMPPGLFKPLESRVRIVDCICVGFPVVLPAWCLMVFVRCGVQPPFDENDEARLRRLRLPLVRVVKDGYRREMHLHGPQSAAQPASSRHSIGEVYSRLSNMERQVFSFLCVDATEREIGDSLTRSPHTIHVHVKNIYRKLGVCSRRQLAAMFADADVPLPEPTKTAEHTEPPEPPSTPPVPPIPEDAPRAEAPRSPEVTIVPPAQRPAAKGQELRTQPRADGGQMSGT